jgi:hypothetical protein
VVRSRAIHSYESSRDRQYSLQFSIRERSGLVSDELMARDARRVL